MLPGRWDRPGRRGPPGGGRPRPGAPPRSDGTVVAAPSAGLPGAWTPHPPLSRRGREALTGADRVPLRPPVAPGRAPGPQASRGAGNCAISHIRPAAARSPLPPSSQAPGPPPPALSGVLPRPQRRIAHPHPPVLHVPGEPAEERRVRVGGDRQVVPPPAGAQVDTGRRTVAPARTLIVRAGPRTRCVTFRLTVPEPLLVKVSSTSSPVCRAVTSGPAVFARALRRRAGSRSGRAPSGRTTPLEYAGVPGVRDGLARLGGVRARGRRYGCRR